jgi:hypothetical protein
VITIGWSELHRHSQERHVWIRIVTAVQNTNWFDERIAGLVMQYLILELKDRLAFQADHNQRTVMDMPGHVRPRGNRPLIDPHAYNRVLRNSRHLYIQQALTCERFAVSDAGKLDAKLLWYLCVLKGHGCLPGSLTV